MTTSSGGEIDLSEGIAFSHEEGSEVHCRVAVTDDHNWRIGFPKDDQPRTHPSDELWRDAPANWRKRWGKNVLVVRVPSSGVLSVLLVGAGGEPLAERAVELYLPETFNRGPGPIRLSGRTDATGRFHLRWLAGQVEFAVVVPGQGFGGTGLVEVSPGKTTELTLPPLCPFGSAVGRVDLSLGPGQLEVRGNTSDFITSPAKCDEQGRGCACRTGARTPSSFTHS